MRDELKISGTSTQRPVGTTTNQSLPPMVPRPYLNQPPLKKFMGQRRADTPEGRIIDFLRNN